VKERFDLLIAGGGVAGLSAAALLAGSAHAHRLRLRVVDAGRRPAFEIDDDVALRVSAVSAGSASVLAAAGAWGHVTAQRACPFREMRVWDAAGSARGPDALHFDAAEFALPALGHIVENVLLQNALLASLEKNGVQVEFGRSIVDLSSPAASPSGDGRLTAKFDDGEADSVDLVIGADGADSPVRRLAGIPVTSWRYPQSALVTHLAAEASHGNCAWQRFLPDGPLALLPLGDGRVSVVWSTLPTIAEAAMVASDAALGANLSEASDHVLGRLTVAGPRASFRLKAQHAAHYVRPGLALIGDAAHSIHPLAGQGANLGIADAAALARVVSDCIAAGEHPGDWSVLRRYERARKGANQTMLYFVDGLNRLFSSASPALTTLRSAGIRLFNHSGPVRRRAVAVALGVNA
jgi:2-octaprenylphenol hydroxylase